MYRSRMFSFDSGDEKNPEVSLLAIKISPEQRRLLPSDCFVFNEANMELQ